MGGMTTLIWVLLGALLVTSVVLGIVIAVTTTRRMEGTLGTLRTRPGYALAIDADDPVTARQFAAFEAGRDVALRDGDIKENLLAAAAVWQVGGLRVRSVGRRLPEESKEGSLGDHPSGPEVPDVP